MSKKIITGCLPVADPDELSKGLKPLSASKPPHVWLTPAQMEKRYGRSKTYWYLRRKDGTGPKFLPLGARTTLYREDIVEAWLNDRLVQGFDDPKYRAIAATRKAKRAEAKKTSSKIANAQPRRQSCSWLEVGLQQLQTEAPKKRLLHFDWLSQPRVDFGLRTSAEAAQAIVATLSPKCDGGPAPLSVFVKEVIARPA